MKEGLEKHVYQFTSRCQRRFRMDIDASEELPREIIILGIGEAGCELCWNKDGELACPAKGVLLKRGKHTFIGKNSF